MKAYLFIAICALGCGEGKRVTITQTVGSTGGTVETGDGTAVNIPAGALAAQANITIESVNVTPPSGVLQIGPAYDFGPEGSNFANPVTISLVFAPDRIPSGKTTADVRIYTAPRGSSQFTTLSPVIEAGVLAKTSTTHFTTYFPGVPSGAVSVDMAGSDGCVPSSCTDFGVEGCGCTGTCGGKTYGVTCSGSSLVTCYCTIDGISQSVMPRISMCSQSHAASAWQQCTRPLS